MAKKIADTLRYVRGVQDILRKIREEEWQKIEEASRVIADAIMKGHAAYFVSEGHATPLATAYGRAGSANIFTPIEYLRGHFYYSPTLSLRGNVVVVSPQYDSGSSVDDIAMRSKVLGAYVILVGTPSDRDIVPIIPPIPTLPEICDLTINVFTPPRDELLKFDGLDIGALPTSAISAVVVYNILSIEVAERIGRTIKRRVSLEEDPETGMLDSLKVRRLRSK
jgi:uncharacterized phosphosugar-binding protein